MSKVSKTAGVRVPSTSGGGAARTPATQASSARTDSQQALGALRFSDAAVITTRDPALPFIATTKTRRGRWLGQDCFNPEIDDGQHGYLVGLEALALLLDKLNRTDSHYAAMKAADVLMDAGKKADLPGSPTQEAAFALLSAAGELVRFAAQWPECRRYVAERIAMAEQSRQFLEDHQRRQAAAFVSRMSAAKAAKSRAAAPSSVQAPAGVQQ